MKLKPHERQPLDDSNLESRRVLVRMYQQMAPEQKAKRIDELRKTARALFEVGLRTRSPGMTDDEVLEAWMRRTLPPHLFEQAWRHRVAHSR